MRQLNHVNIVQLKHCFYCNGEKVRQETTHPVLLIRRAVA